MYVVPAGISYRNPIHLYYYRPGVFPAYMIAKDEHLFAMAQKPDMSAQDIETLPHSANIRLKEYSNMLHEEMLRLAAISDNQLSVSDQSKKVNNETGPIPF